MNSSGLRTLARLYFVIASTGFDALETNNANNNAVGSNDANNNAVGSNDANNNNAVGSNDANNIDKTNHATK